MSVRQRKFGAISAFVAIMVASAVLFFAPVHYVQAQSAGNLTSLNPIFRPAPFSFTATGTKNVPVNGMATIVIQTKGTFTAMTFNVLGSVDGGTTFIALPIVAGFVGGAAPGAAATQPVTAGNPAVWTTGVKGLTTIQISNICTACTGTVTYTVTGQGN